MCRIGNPDPLITTATARLLKVWPEVLRIVSSTLDATRVVPIGEALASLIDTAEPMFLTKEEQLRVTTSLVAAAKAEAIADAERRVSAMEGEYQARIMLAEARAREALIILEVCVLCYQA